MTILSELNELKEADHWLSALRPGSLGGGVWSSQSPMPVTGTLLVDEAPDAVQRLPCASCTTIQNNASRGSRG